MLDQHQMKKNEIRINFYNKKYLNTINLCKKLLKELDKIYDDFLQITKQEIGFCYFYMSNSYKHLNKLKESMKYAKKAVKQGLNSYHEDNNFSTEAKILLAENYETLHRKDKAIRNYKRSSNFYKKNNCIDNRRHMVFKIAKLLNKPRKMKTIIKFAEFDNERNNEELNSEVSEKYLDLALYYLKLGKINKVKELLRDIENQNVKEAVTSKTLNYLMGESA